MGVEWIVIIGVPKEIKDNENRVAMTPSGVRALCGHGHRVCVQRGAGVGSGLADEEYRAVGAEIFETAKEVFGAAEMIVKVKEPLAEEYDYFSPGQILYTYLHLAPNKPLTNALLEKKVVGIAYETVRKRDGSLPLLTPMSVIAGRMSVQIGAHFLESHRGGRGVLLGGVPGVEPGHVVIVGGGVVGANAARIAAGMGALVTILDVNAKRLSELDDLFGGRVKTMMSNEANIAAEVAYADLLIGAVLIPGAKTPVLVSDAMVRTMKPGAVIVDVAIDQGGSIETIDRISSHSDPVFEKHGVIHYSVANIPGAAARTATFALTNVTMPYALAIADKGWEKALADDPELAEGLNTADGRIVHPVVAKAFA